MHAPATGKSLSVHAGAVALDSDMYWVPYLLVISDPALARI